MKNILMVAMIVQLSDLQAQDSKTEVMTVVNNLFTAMETNDSTLAASVFTRDAKLYTVFKDQNGTTQLRSSPASRLVSAFGQPKAEQWSEPIWNEKVEIDGGLASVWVAYAFYIDNTFSHCGVDAFHLINTPEGWKIFHLADTRRKETCDIPPEIVKRYK